MIYQIPSQYVDAQTIGNIPGVRGGAIGTVAKLAAKGIYRGTKWLSGRLLKPKRFTYRGAVGRGIAIGTGVASIIQEGNDTAVSPPELPGTRSPQQGNIRRSLYSNSRRNNYRSTFSHGLETFRNH